MQRLIRFVGLAAQFAFRAVSAVLVATAVLLVCDPFMNAQVGAVLNMSLGNGVAAETFTKRALEVSEARHQTDTPGYAQALHNLALIDQARGRRSDAERHFRQSLGIRERLLPPDSLDTAWTRFFLGTIYRDAARYAEAAPLLERSLAVREKVQGPEHFDTGVSLNDLGLIYVSIGRYADAEAAYKRALLIFEKLLGPNDRQVGKPVHNLANLYRDLGRYAQSEALYLREIEIDKKAIGTAHPDYAGDLLGLGQLYQAQARNAEAEDLYKRALKIFEDALGPNAREVGMPIHNLAGLYAEQGRYAEAELLYRREIDIDEKVVGTEHPAFAGDLDGLGLLYAGQGRLAEAEQLMTRALQIYKKVLGPNNVSVAVSSNHLGGLYAKLNRTAEAEAMYREAIRIFELALGPDARQVGWPIHNLANLYSGLGRFAEAEALYKREMVIDEKIIGREHPNYAGDLTGLGRLYQTQGRYEEAETLHLRALKIDEKVLGEEHPETAFVLHNLAELHALQSHWVQAAAYWRRATAVIQSLMARAAIKSSGPAGEASSEAQRNDSLFAGLVRASYRLQPEASPEHDATAREMFEMAQWAQGSEAAQSLAKMAARTANGKGDLANLVRERQDLADEWQVKDKLLIASKSQPPDQRNLETEAEIANRFRVVDERIKEVDRQLAKDFPSYDALASPKPLSVAEVQAALREDEALLLFLIVGPLQKALPQETFTWVVTKSATRWLRSDLGAEALEGYVTGLRCGLDADAWVDEKSPCQLLFNGSYSANDAAGGKPLPFDLQSSHDLYKALFSDAADLIKGKHLLIVPSGPLARLPMQVLVTEPTTDENYKNAAWLIRDHAITVLPAVTSLKALRSQSVTSHAEKPMIAFANPALDGDAQADGNDLRRRMAHYRQTCDLPLSPEETFLEEIARYNVASLGLSPAIADIKALEPVPGTARLVCEIARDPAFSGSEVLLGNNATEAALKALSASGEIAKYRIVQFATHGIRAGKIANIAEPGLILSPPEKPADTNDNGYLTASEITELKLDADWVILSACNTASDGGGARDEALSGLARAFFYAQARALLVTHWSVKETAAVTLVTSSVRASAEPGIGRSEALRRAMIDLVTNRSDKEAHPSYWAPFVLVGEGAAD